MWVTYCCAYLRWKEKEIGSFNQGKVRGSFPYECAFRKRKAVWGWHLLHKQEYGMGRATCILVKQKYCHVPIYSLFETTGKKYLLMQRNRAQSSFIPFIIFFLDPIQKYSILVLCNRAVKSEVTNRGPKSLAGGKSQSQSMLPLYSSSCTYMPRVKRKPWLQLKPALFLESQWSLPMIEQ